VGVSELSRTRPIVKQIGADAENYQVPPLTGERPMAAIPVQRCASAATTPASLTQAGASPSGVCPECQGDRLTALVMTLTDGTPVRFASCHDCEHRSWSYEGQELAFADVITRATKQKV
jgi:hypothetical protein